MNRTALAALLALTLPFGALSCGGDGGTSGPNPANFAIRIVSGDGQFAQAGQPLAEPLTVQVRDAVRNEDVEGLQVRWTVVQGSGTTLSRQSTTTDATGTASVQVTLGLGDGIHRIQADFSGNTGEPAEFTAQAVAEAVITGLPTEEVQAGQVIPIEGSGFLPDPASNVVLFSEIRGRVVSATPELLDVEVPACLPTRTVDVVVAFGGVRSAPADLQVRAVGEPLGLSPGQDHVTAIGGGFSCVRLAAGTSYLAVPHSTAVVDGGLFGFHLAGATGEGATASGAAGVGLAGSPPGGALDAESGALAGGAQSRWERVVRGLESELAPPSPSERTGAAAAAAADARTVPDVGDRRSFQVLDADREFTEITAEAVVVGERAVIYEDLNSPDGGLTLSDFQAFSRDFDDPIHPVVTGVYGSESDLDGNDRVVILFTPVVNELTERGSTGFVGGFFFGLDLLPEREGSNGGEIFYTLVADPQGEFGDTRSRETILSVVPAILAHEFQHMVNFNQRALVRNGDFTDALWLSEAVAVMAEDIVGEAFLADGDSSSAVIYQAGNWARAQRWLRDPPAHSLVTNEGQGTLEERGAGWLFLRYLRGLRGDNSILTQLTQTTLTSVTNVEAATGDPWEDLVADWSAAVVLDDQNDAVPPRLQFPDIALRATIDRLQEGWPLFPSTVGSTDFVRTGSLRSSAPAYFRIQAPLTRDIAVTLAGPGGGPPAQGADLQLTLVRLN